MSMLSSMPPLAPAWSVKLSGLSMVAAAALSTAAALVSTLGGGGSSQATPSKKATTGSSSCALPEAWGRGQGGASSGLEEVAGVREEDAPRERLEPAAPSGGVVGAHVLGGAVSATATALGSGGWRGWLHAAASPEEHVPP